MTFGTVASDDNSISRSGDTCRGSHLARRGWDELSEACITVVRKAGPFPVPRTTFARKRTRTWPVRYKYEFIRKRGYHKIRDTRDRPRIYPHTYIILFSPYTIQWLPWSAYKKSSRYDAYDSKRRVKQKINLRDGNRERFIWWEGGERSERGEGEGDRKEEGERWFARETRGRQSISTHSYVE